MKNLLLKKYWKYQDGGLSKTTETQRRRVPIKGKQGYIEDTFYGARIDNANTPSKYTYKGRPQSQETIDKYNKMMDELDVSKYLTPDELAQAPKAIADKYLNKQLDKVTAQLLTQKVANQLTQTKVKQAIATGKLQPGQSINVDGYNFYYDQEGNIKTERADLNKEIGLDPDLKYLTGVYKSELKYDNEPNVPEKDKSKDETLFMVFSVTNNNTKGWIHFYLRNNKTQKVEPLQTISVAEGGGGAFTDFLAMMKVDKSGVIKRAWNNFKKNVGIKIEIPHETFVEIKRLKLLKPSGTGAFTNQVWANAK